MFSREVGGSIELGGLGAIGAGGGAIRTGGGDGGRMNAVSLAVLGEELKLIDMAVSKVAVMIASAIFRIVERKT